MDIISYVLAKKYVDDSLAGAGALKGVPCKIQDISPIAGGNRITFLWEDNDGNEHTSTLDVMNGTNGAKGDKGDKGDRGEQGEQGIQGAQGIQGIQGIQGVKGDTGATGAQGIQGIQGIQGEKGDDGYPFLIYKQYDDISEFDEDDFPEVGLMFMVMQEDFDPDDPSTSIGYPIYRYTGEGNPPYSLVVHLASQGIKGEKGDKGDTGAQGIQGEKGDKGDKGDTGEQGAQGIQGVQGEQGVGMPDGGTTGQVLIKESGNDYDFGFKDTSDTVRPNSHALVESGAVYNAINQALDSVYTPRGDLACAELTASLLVEANVGNVYQMSDSGTTSALFIQGAGQTINANDNVGIVKAGADSYLFNLMGNAFDLHDYQKKDLATPLTIDGTVKTTVESALSALVTKKMYYEVSTINDQNALETNFETLMPEGVNLVFWRKGGSHEVLIVQNTDPDYYSYIWFGYGQPLIQRRHDPVNGWMDSLPKYTRYPDYSHNLYTSAVHSWTAPQDCYFSWTYIGQSTDALLIDGNVAGASDQGTFGGIQIGISCHSGYLRKGQVLTRSSGSSMGLNILKIFPLI